MPPGLFDPSGILLPLAAAIVFALPVAVERKRWGSANIGLRTIPLVAVGACGCVLLVRFGHDGNLDADARILQGVITGIGFVAGGSILKGSHDVHGLATAASIWNSGAIGAASAFGRYDVGLILSVVNFVALHFLPSQWGEEGAEPPDAPAP